MKKKIFIISLYVLFFSITLGPVLYRAIKKDWNCDSEDEFRFHLFNGIILNKYYDSTQHSYKTLEIKNISGQKIKLVLDREKTGFFYNVNMGESIFKVFGSDTVLIKMRTENKVLVVDFGCKKRNKEFHN